jgi:phosphotransacetylase
MSSSTVPTSDEPEIAPARRHAKYDRLIAAAREIRAVPTAVAHPCDESSLKGALDAAAAGMIQPILVGPEGKIRGVAEKLGVDIGAAEIVDVPHSHAAAAKAVELVRTGHAQLIMKGSLHPMNCSPRSRGARPASGPSGE